MIASAGCEIKGGFVKNEAESCFLGGGGVMVNDLEYPYTYF